jgi:hypothetical protein
VGQHEVVDRGSWKVAMRRWLLRAWSRSQPGAARARAGVGCWDMWSCARQAGGVVLEAGNQSQVGSMQGTLLAACSLLCKRWAQSQMREEDGGLLNPRRRRSHW